MLKSKSETQPEERANYKALWSELDIVLGEAIALLKARKPSNADERRLITVEVGLLEADQSKAFAELLAFRAEGLRINPPDAPQVDDMENRSKSLDAMNDDSSTADAIFTLAAAAFVDWQKTRA